MELEDFLSIGRNDTLMNQYCKFHLQSWMANCGLQVVLDEEQDIKYLVEYDSKPGKRSTSINGLIQTMLPTH